MIIGLIGAQGVGKSHIGGLVEKRHNYQRAAIADILRDMAYRINPRIAADSDLKSLVDVIGWEATKRKYPEARDFLINLGMVLRQTFGDDVLLTLLHKAHRGLDLVVTDIRMQNEIDWVRENDGVIWRIEREQHEHGQMWFVDYATSNYAAPTEYAWRNCVPDVVVYNPGTDYSEASTALVVDLAMEASSVLDRETMGGVMLPVSVSVQSWSRYTPGTPKVQAMPAGQFYSFMGEEWMKKNGIEKPKELVMVSTYEARRIQAREDGTEVPVVAREVEDEILDNEMDEAMMYGMMMGGGVG